MTPDHVLSLTRDAAVTALLLAGPLLGAILVTGLLVSLFQAVTQIQELTLTFVPKVLAVVVVVALLGHWMLGQLVGFTTNLLNDLGTWAR